jgi:hypothetical protein
MPNDLKSVKTTETKNKQRPISKNSLSRFIFFENSKKLSK